MQYIHMHACMYDGTSPQAHVMISMRAYQLAAWGAKTSQLSILTQPID